MSKFLPLLVLIACIRANALPAHPSSGVDSLCQITMAEFLSVKDELHKDALALIEGGDSNWKYDYGTREDLSHSWFFHDVLDSRLEESFSSLIVSLKDHFKHVNALDLFGSGVFEGSKWVDNVTAVRLLDVPLKSEVRELPRSRHVIQGDLSQTAVWKNVWTHMKQNKIPYYDLIVIRPMGAFDKMEFTYYLQASSGDTAKLAAFNLLYRLIIMRAYSLLNPNGGQLFAQLPSLGPYGKRRYLKWVETLFKSGIKVRLGTSPKEFQGIWQAPIVRMTKTQASQKRLPIMPIED